MAHLATPLAKSSIAQVMRISASKAIVNAIDHPRHRRYHWHNHLYRAHRMNASLLYGTTTLAELLVAATQRHAQKIAFLDERGDITYQELPARVSQAVTLFGQCGIKGGDPVARLAGNRVETFVIMMACYPLGAHSVALHPLGGDDDQVFVLNDSQAQMVIVDGQHVARVSALREKCPGVTHWFSHDGGHRFDDFWKQARALPVSELRPQGVMLSNRSLVTYVMLALAGISWPDDVRLLCTTPITHAAGSLILPTLVRGGSVLLQQGFDAGNFAEALEKQRCNVTFLVPTLIYALLDDPRSRHANWNEMHALIYGAAPMAPQRIREALQVFGPCLVQVYGQTESPNLVLTLTQRDHLLASDQRLASAGRPFTGLRVALRDDEGRDVAGTGEIGEICVQGPLLMSGYWQQPEATAQAFSDSWLHTGDMGYRDEQGYYYLVDRKKDLIISGGFNVYPTEVENTLCTHPEVAAAAVVGVPDEKWGEAVKAFVVLRPGATVDASTLTAMVRKARGAVHAPKSIEFTDVLPLTNLGKVDKKQLRAPYWADSKRAIH